MRLEAEVREAMTLFVVVRSRERLAAGDLDGNAKDFAPGQSCETPTWKHIVFRFRVLCPKPSHFHSRDQLYDCSLIALTIDRVHLFG
jgi:hypothetical protein